MDNDSDMQKLVDFIEKETKKGLSYHQIAKSLEDEGIDSEKIGKAIMLAGQNKGFKVGFLKYFVKDSSTVYTPILVYSVLQFIFLIIFFILSSKLLYSLFKIHLGFFTGLALVIITLILSVGSYILDAFILHFSAGLFTKENYLNTMKSSLWIILITNIASIYFIGVIVLSFFMAKNSTNNILGWLTFFLIILVLRFLFILLLVGFIYNLSLGGAFLCVLVFAIIKFVVGFVTQFLYNSLLILVFKISLSVGAALFF
jgi:hypothetical protein